MKHKVVLLEEDKILNDGWPEGLRCPQPGNLPATRRQLRLMDSPDIGRGLPSTRNRPRVEAWWEDDHHDHSSPAPRTPSEILFHAPDMPQFPAPFYQTLEGRRAITLAEQRIAEHLIGNVRQINPMAKPFCIKPDTNLNEPFIVHKAGKYIWSMEPLRSERNLVPNEALTLLDAVKRAGYPITDERVGFEGKALPREREKFENSLKWAGMIIAQVAVTAMTLPFMFTADPVLVVKVGKFGGFYVELFRWDI